MTDRLPEPGPDAPVPNGHLRASDRDREQVAAILNTAYAEGRLTAEEHEERLDQALRSRTFAELAPLTSDVRPSRPPSASTGLTPATPTTYTLDTTHPTGDSDVMVAVFSGTTRKGRWRVRRSLKTIAVFGGVDLDLTEAILESRTTEIVALSCFGGLDVHVPAGMTVRDETIGIFGGSDIRRVTETDPGAPVLVIKGLALFGGVNVRGPKPPSPKPRR
ncbi:MAG: hypothetical protein JWP61_1537 [Friedmanniella sp.]|nr:hypothetical protein [Friedmanniella sp.]